MKDLMGKFLKGNTDTSKDVNKVKCSVCKHYVNTCCSPALCSRKSCIKHRNAYDGMRTTNYEDKLLVANYEREQKQNIN